MRHRFGYRRIGLLLEHRGMVMMPLVFAPNQRCTLDFVAAAFVASRKFRTLVVIGDCCGENLCLIAATSISGAKVARELNAWVRVHGGPTYIASDRRR